MEKHSVSLHGHDIAYFHEGSGPALLLLHGMAGQAETWEHVIPLLAEHYTVVAPDLIGHGQSARENQDFSLGGFANSLRDLLVRLGIDRATVVGQSFGGGVALQFSHQFSDMCERLVLVSAGGLGPDVNRLLRVLSVPGGGWLLTAGCRPAITRVASAIGNMLRRWGWRGSRVLKEIARSYVSLTDSDTRRAFLHTLRSVIDSRGQRVSATDYLYLARELPCLIIWGDSDPVIPVKHAQATHERLPGSRLEIFPGVGHFPHVEAPERFARVVLEFIRSTQPATLTKSRRRELMLAAG